jgi:hypothetical protein
MTKLSRAALFASVILLAAAPAGRAQTHGPQSSAPEATELRVVNNHGYRVGVVLVDAGGKHHTLGRVGNGDVRIFALAGRFADRGSFRVKVFTDEPVWSAGSTEEAIRSRDLQPRSGEAVTVWVEPDLTRSRITLGR